MKRRHVTIVSIILGILFLIVGIAGLILPIIPGIIFILIGLSFLGYPISLKWFDRFKIKKKSSR